MAAMGGATFSYNFGHGVVHSFPRSLASCLRLSAWAVQSALVRLARLSACSPYCSYPKREGNNWLLCADSE
jgi:hypothetical protein